MSTWTIKDRYSTKLSWCHEQKKSNNICHEHLDKYRNVPFLYISLQKKQIIRGPLEHLAFQLLSYAQKEKQKTNGRQKKGWKL